MRASVLIGLVMAWVALERVPPGATLPETAPVLLAVASLALGVFAVGLILGALILWQRRSLSLSGRPLSGEQNEQRFFRRVGLWARAYRLGGLVAYAVILFALDWAVLAEHWTGGRGAMAIPYVLTVAPMLGLLVLSWTALYWADRRLRAMVLERAGLPAAAAPPALARYLVFLFRQFVLVVLGPLLGLLAIHDVLIRLFGPIEAEPIAALAMGGAVLAAVMVAGPWIRLCWPTAPLPDGDLRQRLTALAERARVRVADILVWRTHRSIANGCMVGSVGPLRYILITDVLLLSLPNEELEAVFAHEMGHVKYRHVILYLILAVGAVAVATLVSGLLAAMTSSAAVAEGVAGGLVVAYWGLGFGYISRRCELECDLYAVRAMSCPVVCSPPDSDRDAQGNADRPMVSIGEHGIRAFTSALRRIAHLNGTAETARGWRHFSVARRCRFLADLLADPSRAERFDRRLRRLKRLAVALSLVAVALAASAVLVEALEADNPQNPARPQNVAPQADRWLVSRIRRNQVDAVAFRTPEFHRHADPSAHLDDGGLARLRRRVAPRDDDVAVQNPRRHAVAVHTQAERARHRGLRPSEVNELQASLGRRLG